MNFNSKVLPHYIFDFTAHSIQRPATVVSAEVDEVGRSSMPQLSCYSLISRHLNNWFFITITVIVIYIIVKCSLAKSHQSRPYCKVIITPSLNILTWELQFIYYQEHKAPFATYSIW